MEQDTIKTVPSGLAICTIVSKNYLAQARVLAESLEAHNPGIRLFVLVTDWIDGYFDPTKEPFSVVRLDELAIPNLPRFCFQYRILELNTASKPYFLEYLLAKPNVDRVLYFDPDIMVFDSLEPLAQLLQRHPIVLTPHLTEIIDDDRKPGELDALKAGTFNLGFLGIARHPESARLLKWWKDRLYTGCRIEPEHAMFVDQRWMDLVVGYFAGVCILRDPAYNIAYWNLHGRKIALNNGKVFVNGLPCRFFHFSGFDPEKPEIVSRHQNR